MKTQDAETSPRESRNVSIRDFNTLSYDIGSNSTIRNSFNNSKVSPSLNKINWLKSPNNTRSSYN
jgi:hypothetical protein